MGQHRDDNGDRGKEYAFVLISALLFGLLVLGVVFYL